MGIRAIDQRGNEHAASAFGQPAGELIRLRDAGLKTYELLRCLVRVGDGHHGSLGLAFRNQHQTIGLHPTDHRPTHREDFESAAAAHFGRITGKAAGYRCRNPQLRRPASIHDAEDTGQLLTVGLDGQHISLRRIEIPVPMAGTGLGCRRQNTVQVAVDAPDQGLSQIARLGQRFGSGHHGR